MSNQMLSGRQVFSLYRIDIKDEDIFIEVHYTMKEAVKAVAEIEEWFEGHKMRIDRTFIEGEETVDQRNANEQL